MSASEARTFRFELSFPPLLESWEARTHPSQVKLEAYRAALREVAEPALAVLEPPLFLSFHAAGRPDIRSPGGCDLDNFLTPVVKALGGGSSFAAVAAARGSASERARLTLASAELVPAPAAELSWRSVTLTGSPERREWKERIATTVGLHPSSETDSEVEVDLKFLVSPLRNWVTLWKPAIDALGGILGEDARPWHPHDHRIGRLMLRRSLRAETDWGVTIDVGWREL